MYAFTGVYIIYNMLVAFISFHSDTLDLLQFLLFIEAHRKCFDFDCAHPSVFAGRPLNGIWNTSEGTNLYCGRESGALRWVVGGVVGGRPRSSGRPGDVLWGLLFVLRDASTK